MTMRKFITLSLLFILPLLGMLALPGRAQDKPDKWSKARDYLNCRLSLAVIQQKAKANPGLKPQLDQIQGPLSIVTVEDPLTYDNLVHVLQGFDKVLKNLTIPISKLNMKKMSAFTDHKDGVTMLMDSVFDILKKSYSDVYDSVEKAYRGALTEDVAKVLAPPHTVATTTGTVPAGAAPGAAGGGTAGARDSGHKQGVKDPVNPATADSGGFFAGFSFWTLVSLMVSLGVFVFAYRKIDTLEGQNKQRIKDLSSFTENYRPVVTGGAAGGGATGAGNATGSTDRKELDKVIQNRIADLNDAISKLQNQVSQLENKLSKVKPEPVQQAGLRTIYQEPSKPDLVVSRGPAATSGPAAAGPAAADVFYMVGPVNNYFPISAKSSSKDNTVYKFQVSANRQEASFELHTAGAPVMEIVRSAQSYIKPACDEENNPGPNVKNIVTVRPGMAILEGDKWIINNKALIRYE